MNSEAGWGVGRVREEGVECHLYANLKSGEGEWGNTGEKELNHKQHCLRPEKAFFSPLILEIQWAFAAAAN